jgi:hypothetical protein
MLLALLLAQAAPGPAKPACPAPPAALPVEYAGWTAGGTLTAATEPAAVGDAILTVGRGARAALKPAGALKLPVAPKRRGAHGGLFAFEANTAGRYRVALGAAHWVEVVANGAAIPSVAHGHGPDCTPVRKFVDWDLKPGRYLLQVTGDPAAVQLLLAKLG